MSRNIYKLTLSHEEMMKVFCHEMYRDQAMFKFFENNLSKAEQQSYFGFLRIYHFQDPRTLRFIRTQCENNYMHIKVTDVKTLPLESS